MATLPSLPFIRALQQQQARVYTVGGTVRDELLGHPSKDIDLLVTGLPQRALIRCLRKHGRVQLTGRVFGVIKFFPHHWDDHPIDIALPRTEISTGTGHREFEVTFDHTLPVDVDLGRRDFTINALAIDLATNQLIDPFGGLQDLQQRVLRQVSEQAFPEDPLRILRGVQLAARFHLRVDTVTHRAMQSHAASITTISPERIAEEFRKLFQATTPSSGFLLMHETGILSYVLPEVTALRGHSRSSHDAFAHTLRRIDIIKQHEALTYRGHLDLLLAALFHDVGLADAPATATTTQIAEAAARQARQRLEVLRMTMIGAQLDRIERLIAHSRFAAAALAPVVAFRRFVHDLSLDTTRMVFDLQLADHLAMHPAQPIDEIRVLQQRLSHDIAQHVPFAVKELAINGHDLQRLGMPPGPPMGQLLLALLTHVWDDPARNTRDYLLAQAQRAMTRGMRPHTPGPTGS